MPSFFFTFKHALWENMTFSQIKHFLMRLLPTWDMIRGLSVIYQAKLPDVPYMMQKIACQYLYLYGNGKTFKTIHHKKTPATIT